MANPYPRTIEYHHDIGDKVFFMQKNKVMQGEITGLIATLYKAKDGKKTKIDYNVIFKNEVGESVNILINQDLLFESKSKLLDTL